MMKDKKAMADAAMRMLEKMKDIDLNDVGAITFSLVMKDPKRAMKKRNEMEMEDEEEDYHTMPDGSKMAGKKHEMEEEEDEEDEEEYA